MNRRDFISKLGLTAAGLAAASTAATGLTSIAKPKEFSTTSKLPGVKEDRASSSLDGWPALWCFNAHRRVVRGFPDLPDTGQPWHYDDHLNAWGLYALVLDRPGETFRYGLARIRWDIERLWKTGFKAAHPNLPDFLEIAGPDLRLYTYRVAIRRDELIAHPHPGRLYHEIVKELVHGLLQQAIPEEHDIAGKIRVWTYGFEDKVEIEVFYCTGIKKEHERRLQEELAYQKMLSSIPTCSVGLCDAGEVE